MTTHRAGDDPDVTGAGEAAALRSAHYSSEGTKRISERTKRIIGAGLPTSAFQRQAEEWMRQAMQEARRTPDGDVPVGAIVVDPDGRRLAAATNTREQHADPTAHAEVRALQAAAAAYGDGWRLRDCTLIVTLEPCAMCAGAALLACVGTIIFGAYEPKTGACGSVVDVLRDPHWPSAAPAVVGGVLADENGALLTDFFATRRDMAPSAPDEPVADLEITDD